jgi:hypothetical protein
MRRGGLGGDGFSHDTPDLVRNDPFKIVAHVGSEVKNTSATVGRDFALHMAIMLFVTPD